MLVQHECSIVVVLASVGEQRNAGGFYEYWPRSSGERRAAVNYGGVLVDAVSEFDMTHYVVREFRIADAGDMVSVCERGFSFFGLWAKLAD